MYIVSVMRNELKIYDNIVSAEMPCTTNSLFENVI